MFFFPHNGLPCNIWSILRLKYSNGKTLAHNLTLPGMVKNFSNGENIHRIF
jgi:hypothetical protein